MVAQIAPKENNAAGETVMDYARKRSWNYAMQFSLREQY